MTWSCPSGYNPSDLQGSYGLSNMDGSGQTVAIVDGYDGPKAESDLGVCRRLGRHRHGRPSRQCSRNILQSADSSQSADLPPSAAILLVLGRRLIPYLSTAGLQSFSSYSVYLEEILTVLMIILAYNAFEAAGRRRAPLDVMRAALASLFGLLTQPVTALTQRIKAYGQRLRPGYDNHSDSADTVRPELIASPHSTLNVLLRGFEASGGFIAVRQGNCFTVVASVNSLPVGNSFELTGAAAADHLRIITSDARIATPGRPEELAGEPAAHPDHSFELMVEQALKGLSDYAVLGQSSLVSRLRLAPASQIQQAKVLRGMLVDTIESLRPAGNLPSGVLPRGWHAYTILHDAYVEDVPNRDIMSKLYISEGTFASQRRKALHAVATAIWELRQSDAALMDKVDQGGRFTQAGGQLAGSKI